MGLRRDKFRGIVGGITTAQPEASDEPASPEIPVIIAHATEQQPAAEEQGEESILLEKTLSEETRRFAKRGRPKGRKDETPTDKAKKVKISLFLSETLIQDLYDWAHEDRIHPGEMFERALKPFHEKEKKRRNGGKE